MERGSTHLPAKTSSDSKSAKIVEEQTHEPY